MSDLTVRTTEMADRIGDVLSILADDSAGLDGWIAAFAVGQQLRLRMDRALKGRRDDIIMAMERDGLKELGPLSIKSAAVDPKYVVNDPENYGDSTIQDALAAMKRDPFYAEFVRDIPQHLEIDVPALIEAMRLGSQPALDLYREMNLRGWRTEQARRLSLAVREVKGKAA